MDFRREMLDPARNELGRIAVALTTSTNSQHRAGQDLHGDLGGDFFAVGGVRILDGRANTGIGHAHRHTYRHRAAHRR